MKRYTSYGICALLILITAIICFAAGALVSRPKGQPESAISNATYETETVTEHQMVINQNEVEPMTADANVNASEQFYLVSETGYLLVFAQDRSTICLHTHIPISEFPEKEQERLREGIWFPSMMEIFHYLESYTS